MAVTLTGKDGQSDTTIVDYDELDSLLSGLGFLADANWSLTTLPSFDAVYTTRDGLAILYARLGEKEKALQALEQAYKERQFHMTEIGVEPAFDTLRSEPRFQDLLHRTGVQR